MIVTIFLGLVKADPTALDPLGVEEAEPLLVTLDLLVADE